MAFIKEVLTRRETGARGGLGEKLSSREFPLSVLMQVKLLYLFLCNGKAKAQRCKDGKGSTNAWRVKGTLLEVGRKVFEKAGICCERCRVLGCKMLKEMKSWGSCCLAVMLFCHPCTNEALQCPSHRRSVAVQGNVLKNPCPVVT